MYKRKTQREMGRKKKLQKKEFSFIHWHPVMMVYSEQNIVIRDFSIAVNEHRERSGDNGRYSQRVTNFSE